MDKKPVTHQKSSSKTPDWRSKAKGHDANAPFWISGRHPVREALKAGLPAERLLLRGKPDSALAKELRKLASAESPRPEYCENQHLDRVMRHTDHRGVALKLKPLPQLKLVEELPALMAKDPQALVLVLDGIQDPQNLGSVARTAEATGVSALIVGESAQAPLSDASFRSSAGALAWLPVWHAESPETALRLLGKKGLKRVGLSEKSERSILEGAGKLPLALVLGGEGRGLSQKVRQQLDLVLRLPMRGHVDSLNASAAAAVCLYQVAREILE